MSRIRTALPLAAALAALALPAAASADYHQVIKDCSDDGQFSRQYKHGDYNAARRHLPTDIREYTDCKAMIDAELAKFRGGSGGGGSGGGGVPGGVSTPSGATASSPADVAALKGDIQRARRSRPSIQAGGQTISPASSGLGHAAGSANKLPLALLIAIVALAALCAAGGIAAAWRRWPALVRAPLRLIRR
jgi:hypothetical protein